MFKLQSNNINIRRTILEKVEWNRSLQIGIEEIDNQHQKLIAIFNRLLDAKKENSEDTVIKDTILEVVNYTQYHFKSEEIFMKRARYPFLKEHMAQHSIFVKQLVNLLQSLKNNNITVADDLVSVLYRWIINHVMEHDKQFGDFLIK